MGGYYGVDIRWVDESYLWVYGWSHICLVVDTYFIVEGGVKHTHNIIMNTNEFNINSINLQRCKC